jgi:SAM-dependent methyltransferase
MTQLSAQFCSEYARHRAAEGRGLTGDALRSLPYLRRGRFAAQWAVRARSYEAFVHNVLTPAPLDIIDLGAGNGWLCNRLAQMGHRTVALDMRQDDVDGLGAAAQFLRETPALFECVAGSFDVLPFPAARFDIAVFNASLHYATDLSRVLAEAARVTRPGGTLVIMDSPFYALSQDGEAMVAQKQAEGASRFGARAETLLGQDFIEYLTRERLAAALPAIAWSHRRVRYPLWYEMRPLLAKLRGRRTPSRFDLWTALVP